MQSQTLDFGPQCSLLKKNNRGLLLDPAGHHQPVKTLAPRRRPPLLVGKPWLASRPALILGTEAGVFVLKLQVTVCQWLRAERRGKTVWNFLACKQHLRSGWTSHHTGVFHKPPPPPPSTTFLKWHRACAWRRRRRRRWWWVKNKSAQAGQTFWNSVSISVW